MMKALQKYESTDITIWRQIWRRFELVDQLLRNTNFVFLRKFG